MEHAWSPPEIVANGISAVGGFSTIKGHDNDSGGTSASSSSSQVIICLTNSNDLFFQSFRKCDCVITLPVDHDSRPSTVCSQLDFFISYFFHFFISSG